MTNSQKMETYVIDINVSSKDIHVEHEAIVDEIHREPNAEEAECDKPKIFCSK